MTSHQVGPDAGVQPPAPGRVTGGAPRLLIGAGCGLVLWLGCFLQRAAVPDAVAFYVAAIALTFGCGALPVLLIGAELPRFERLALSLGLGLALSSALVCIVTLSGYPALFPPLAFAASGASVALWHGRGFLTTRVPARGAWLVLIPALVFATSAWVSSGRMTMTPERVALYGNYDTLDLTYYAAISTQLNHTTRLPPRSPFYAGHRIVYSYFPLALLGAIHTLTGVSTLKAFLWFGWPFFNACAAAMMLALCRRLGGTVFAVLATVLVFVGSGLAYLVAWWAPEMVQADPLIWSSVFLAPSAEWLPFNPWAPTLAVIGAGLYAVDRLSGARWKSWAVIASLCFGFAFMFKSFSFLILAPAIACAAAVSLLRREAWWARLAAVAIGTGLCALPWAAAVLPYNRLENRGALVAVSYLTLVRRMLFKTDISGMLESFVLRFVDTDPYFRLLLTLAIVIFLIGGLGARIIGVPGVLRAATGRGGRPAWTLLAWIVILGVALPFFVSIAPFPNSIQTYQFGMFALAPFTALVLWPPAARPTPIRWLATAALIACSVPATLHYFRTAHDARLEPPIMEIGGGDLRIIRYLGKTDPTFTMLLHSVPLYPSLYAVEAERRVVLAWSSYVSGDENPEVDALSTRIERFFGSPSSPGSDDVDLLERYRVTHVIERIESDRLHPHVLEQLRLVTGSPAVRLYEVVSNLPR